MNAKSLLLVLTFVFLISSISALETLGGSQVNIQYEFCQVCSDATYITLSAIQTPTINIPLDVNMTSTAMGQYCYNYTPSEIGRYDFKGVSDGCDKTYATYLTVTPKGFEDNTTTFIIFILVSTGLLVLSFIFKNELFSFFAGLCYLATGVYTMIYGFSSVTSTYTRMLSFVILGFGAILAIVSAFDFMDNNYGGGGDYDYDDD